MSRKVVSEVDSLIDRFHTREPLRIWSLIITVFGDSIVPRGGELWLGSLLELMARLRIDPGAVRAANSRLVSDGWLTRERQGRKSYYRLATKSREEFGAATRRIYAVGGPEWTASWTVCILLEPAGVGRDHLRRDLLSLGYGSVSANVLVRPETSFSTKIDRVPESALVFEATTLDPYVTGALDPGIWHDKDADQGFRDTVEAFAPLADALAVTDNIDPLSALAARTLLIHDFRRAVLQDPMLPPEVRGDAWIGDDARALAADLYHRLLGPSEAWWDAHGQAIGGPLPLPDDGLRDRFRAAKPPARP